MKIAPRRIYLDLDRTLIDTDMVISALFTACQDLYGVTEDSLRGTITDFYHGDGNLRFYDFFAHIQAHDIDPQRAAEDLQQQLADQDFVYPDAHEMLAFLTSKAYPLQILSFGKHDFQQFKYRLAPQLHAIPFSSILYEKARFLAELDSGQALIIDDRPVGPLPSTIVQFLIDREAPYDLQRDNEQCMRIRSLKIVETLLTVGYNEQDLTGTSA